MGAVPVFDEWFVDVSLGDLKDLLVLPGVVSQRLRELADLPFGWFPGISAPSNEVLAAVEFVLVGLLDLGVALPHIYPSEDGGVLLEWDVPGRFFEVEFLNAGVVRVLRDVEDAPEVSFGLGERERVVSFVRDFLVRVSGE